MKVGYYLPKDNEGEDSLSGCDLWRIGLPLKTAGRLDAENEYKEFGEFKFKVDENYTVTGTNLDPDEYDLIHVGRPVVREFINMANVIKESGIKFTMDFDDDFTDVHEENVARERFTDDLLESFMEIVSIADGVTVTTPFLKEKFGHLNDNFEVIPNYIPEALIRKGIRQKENILGWAGGVTVHPRDLQVVGTSVRDFLWKNRDWKFHHIGDGKVNKILKCPTVEFGNQTVLNYMGGIEQFKVGMAPLEESDFNRSKSRLKVLEMAALGVPWIASPLPSYVQAHEDSGAGILADSEEEWLDSFQTLSSNNLLYMQHVQRGFNYAKKNTLEGNWHRWRDFFAKTLDN